MGCLGWAMYSAACTFLVGSGANGAGMGLSKVTHPMQAGWLLRRGQLGEPRGEILLGALKHIQRVT